MSCFVEEGEKFDLRNFQFKEIVEYVNNDVQLELEMCSQFYSKIREQSCRIGSGLYEIIKSSYNFEWYELDKNKLCIGGWYKKKFVVLQEEEKDTLVGDSKRINIKLVFRDSLSVKIILKKLEERKFLL